MPFYENCQELYTALNTCLKTQKMATLLNKCQVQEDELMKCMKKEYIKRKRASKKMAKEREERLQAVLEETGVPDTLKNPALNKDESV